MGWWKTAQPGDKVVCVRGGHEKTTGRLSPLVIGRIYTISRIFPNANWKPGVSVHLAEIGFFSDFSVSLFRPVEKKRGSASREVEKLKDLLNTEPIPADLVPTREEA